MRREWIEMHGSMDERAEIVGLPPCGGSGLKCRPCKDNPQIMGLPPCGGSGLKWLTVALVTPRSSLPPCGGSGLKFLMAHLLILIMQSPSMRREWIEIWL